MKKSILALYFTTAILCACTEEPRYQCIVPLSPAYSLDSFDDVTVPAEFSIGDFDWEGNTLTLTVWSKDLYDAVEVSLMAPGDTLVYGGERIVVSEVGQVNSVIEINKGHYDGGASLAPLDGGVYRTYGYSGHANFTKLGCVTLSIDEAFCFIDCGEDYNDPSDTVTSSHRQYLESKVDKNFWPLNTEVRIVQGKVVSIHRRWIP